ncbi:multicopper oxidase family protein [Streptomyces sp. URMC 129]|uniref:multicopper oxidase family protein n=1 Tax=Streptomyces sp. URMC 129 TaxID=3423407 RepID=UPI003F1E39F1
MLRRSFLRAGTLTGSGLLLPGATAVPAVADPAAARPTAALTGARDTTPVLDAALVPRFVNALPRPPRIDGTKGGRRNLFMAQTTQDVIGGGLGLRTPVWGFGERAGQGAGAGLRVFSPGPTIVARAGQPLGIDWANLLPFRHLLPVDETIHWALSDRPYSIEERGVPTVVHLHGAHSLPGDDGHPEAWYTASGATGPRFGGTGFGYGNDQEGATLWYHDHTMGLTRLNIYAGLAGMYLLRDDDELRMIAENMLPRAPYELELIIQDRTFHTDGRLAYPAPGVVVPGRTEHHPEFYGNVVLVNGTAWPYLETEPRQYRLRLLNASNARFYRLSCGGQWPFPVSLIGTDGGFVERPVRLDRPLLLAPGERVDLVADFREAAGATFDLTNDASAPYPDGLSPVGTPVGDVLRFRVGRPYDDTVPEPTLPRALRDGPYVISASPVRTRRLTLLDMADEHGRRTPMLGTVEQGALGWSDPVTERPVLNEAEIWEFYNTTPVAHVCHVHLVQFQVLDEAPFTAEKDAATGALSAIRIGEPVPLAPAEAGPKDTIRVPPGHVTRIKAVFDAPGHYVWHCHVLEHEDHSMMRRIEVVT